MVIATRSGDPAFENIEMEELVLYGTVEERLKKAGPFHKTAHVQTSPPEQVKSSLFPNQYLL